jgi:hypothetical protein
MTPMERVFNTRWETVALHTDDVCEPRSRFLHPAYVDAFRPGNALINPARRTVDIGPAKIDPRPWMDPRFAPMRVFTMNPWTARQTIPAFIMRYMNTPHPD